MASRRSRNRRDKRAPIPDFDDPQPAIERGFFIWSSEMAKAKLWSGVQVAVQSALATAQTITGVSKANPGVVTFTGTAPTAGAYVAITANGMTQIAETKPTTKPRVAAPPMNPLGEIAFTPLAAGQHGLHLFRGDLPTFAERRRFA